MSEGKIDFTQSWESNALYRYLIEIPIGGIVHFSEMSKVVHRNASGSDSFVQSAINRTLRDNGMVFSNIKGVGYKRLSNSEIIRDTGKDASSIRRKAKKSASKLETIEDYNTLSPHERIRAISSLSIYNLVAHISRESSIKKLGNNATISNNKIDYGDTLSLLRF